MILIDHQIFHYNFIFIIDLAEPNTETSTNSIKIVKESVCIDLFPGFLPISHFTKPSMETFYCDIFKPKLPAILEGIQFYIIIN